MNRVAALAFVCCALVAPLGASAQQQDAQTAAAPAAPSRTFNDPAMSFTAPDDFTPIPMQQHDPVNFEQPTVVAAYVKNPGRQDMVSISLSMDSFQSGVDGWEMNAENNLRTQTDGVFIKKTQTTLPNGMPAYWLEVTVGSGFDQMKSYEYVWSDGVRGISLSIIGRYGAISESAAKKALANVSAVAYPKYRY